MKLFSRSRTETLALEPVAIPDEPAAMENNTPEVAESPDIPRQLYLILYPKEVEEEVLATLESAGVPGYTEFPRLLGRGRIRRHFDNPIWPGAVGAVFTVVSANQADKLIPPFAALSEELESRTRGLHGLHMFMLPCQQVI